MCSMAVFYHMGFLIYRKIFSVFQSEIRHPELCSGCRLSLVPIHWTSSSVLVCPLFSAQMFSWTWSPCKVPWLLKKYFFSKSKCSYYFFLVPKPAKILFQHLVYGDCCKSHVCLLFHTDNNMLHGPVFLQEPSSVIFPLDSEEKKVKLNCEVKGNPQPTIGLVASFPVPLHIPYSCPAALPTSHPHLSAAAPEGGALSVLTWRKNPPQGLHCNTIVEFEQDFKRVTVGSLIILAP